MNVTPETPGAVAIRPPELIHSLVGGFSAVANNIYLILLPVALDLLLWFAPHLRVKALMEPDFNEMIRLLRETSPANVLALLDSLQNSFKLTLGQFNLFSFLSTFPLGVPSLIAGQRPMQTPVGTPLILEVHSYGQYFTLWIGLSLLGLVLGSIYFANVAQVCGKLAVQEGASSENDVECRGAAAQIAGATTALRVPSLQPRVLAWEFLQIFALLLVMLGIILILTLPALAIATVLAAFSPFLSSAAIMLIFFSAIWFLIPLVFSPHGIFLCGQSVFNAMLNSMRLVRFAMPGVGMFLLALIAINMGQSLLWRTPPGSSWMMLVGVLGNAFVVTALLSASFIYYRNGLAYMQAVRKMMVKKI
jgi:hypothetical protein